MSADQLNTIKRDGVVVRCGEQGIELCLEDSGMSPTKVLSTLMQMRINVEKPEVIVDAIKNPGSWVLITKEPTIPDVMIEISDDEMEAYATYLPGFCSFQLSEEEILKLLKDKGLELISDDVAKMLLHAPLEKILVAKGVPPVDGEDASLEWVYQKPVNPVAEDVQYVDFREIISKWDYVTAGTVLVEKKPPQRGTPGKTVKGRIIAAKDGRDIDLRKMAGKNTLVTEDGLKIIAKIDGVVVKEGTRVSIISQLIVSGDVDYHTGNIEDFVDAVQIMGTVREGFKVKAKTSIQVHGVVEGAQLEAGQNIKIDGVVAGNDKAILVAGNAVMARQITKARVQAPIVIAESGVLFSHVECTDLYLTHSKARIAGSTIVAERFIVAPNVGNDLAERVVLQITAPKSLNQEYEHVARVLSEKRKEYNEIQELAKKSPTMLKLYEEKMAILATEIEVLDDRVKELLLSIQDSLKKARVFVRETVYPNVEIRFGSTVYLVRNELSFVTFVFEDGQVKFYPFNTPPPIPRVIMSR